MSNMNGIGISRGLCNNAAGSNEYNLDIVYIESDGGVFYRIPALEW